MLCNQTVVVVIPALNEARSIARVLDDMPGWVDRVVVADNGSTDSTGDIARERGALVVREERRGYGSACQAGLRAAPEMDLVAFIDGDFSDDPSDLVRVAMPVAEGSADLVIGARVPEECEKNALALHQRVGNWLACCLISALHGFNYSDLGPMRCIRRQALEDLDMSDPDFGWTAEMQVKAARGGIRVREVPVRYRRRIGQSKISGTVSGSLRAAGKILYWTLRPRPSSASATPPGS